MIQVIMRGQPMAAQKTAASRKFRHAGLESYIVFSELDRKIDDRGPEIQFGQQIARGVHAEFHGAIQIDVRAGITDLRGETRKLRPRNAVLNRDAV